MCCGFDCYVFMRGIRGKIVVARSQPDMSDSGQYLSFEEHSKIYHVLLLSLLD